MSTDPTRCDSRATCPELGSPLQKGNRVLESIASQEALRALVAFGDLREQIRNRCAAGETDADRDWVETEHFILDEVLQLICDRVAGFTTADVIMVALAEGSDLVCRAASGEFAIARGLQLAAESSFLQDCLKSGRILCCDDCEADPRLHFDIARVINARSTAIVPLRGRHQQLGVLQAFSTRVGAFSDYDIRCFDLFAELVLSAMKPEDQDRRVGWLSDVADEVLRPKPPSAVPENDTADEPAEASAFPLSSEQSVANGSAENDTHDVHEPTLSAESSQSGPVAPTPSLSANSRPGLGVVLSLVIVAALFSAGTWWFIQAKGTRLHGTIASARLEGAKLAGKKIAGKKIGDKKTADTKGASSPQPVSAPLSAGTDSATAADNLLSVYVGSGNSAKGAIESSDAVPEGKTTASKVTGVRHWSSSVGSTVVIDMEDQVPYEVHRLASPERIYFDLHDTVLAPELEKKTMDVGDASLSRVRIGQPVTGITRVVLDTKAGANFSVSMESNPYRLVVELRDKANNQKVLAANNAAPNPIIPGQIPAPNVTLPSPSKAAPLSALPSKASGQPLPPKTGKFRIVLDAGHGGWDLGTVGRHGLLEKDLVLDVTERLGELLQSRLGSEVLFTRTDDTYLPLDQRADIANQVQADLFVSVHANYSTSASARGIETYYTNMFAAPGSKEIEKHEDGSLTKPSPVSLSIEGLHEKIGESRRLAASVQRSLYNTLAANNPDIRNRGIKDADFAVLTGTIMPAILTEISFVSSPADEHNLQSPAYRQEVAEALYQGIARYQQSSTAHAKVAQLQPNAAQR
jgi:N-acetylmuramoyl-L-alanine amidase